VKHRQGIALILLLTVFFTAQACGKKAPPFLPKRETPFKVEQLKAECVDGVFHLTGAIVDSEGRAKEVSNITGCRVYHACYALDNPPCEGCPIDYGEFKEIKGDIITQGQLSCRVPLEKEKGIHFFKVCLIGQEGEIGPMSDSTKLIIED
jgi:predicted small lipoprotein YifL